MGNSASAEEDESVGYRVLGVWPNSPATAVGLVSFFDFIVSANGVPLRKLDSKFIEMVKAAEDQVLPITIYNYKSQTSRDVEITPSRKWGGHGLLGVTIRFDSYYNAEENLVRVVACAAGGPAHIAGLQPMTDYLLGTAEKVFKDADILNEELVKHLDTPMEICVYSAVTDEVRVVIVLPTNNWGGEGCLGAEIGHGYLHALPDSCRSTTGRSVGVGFSVGVIPDATRGTGTSSSASDDVADGMKGGGGGASRTNGHSGTAPNRSEAGTVHGRSSISDTTSGGGGVGGSASHVTAVGPPPTSPGHAGSDRDRDKKARQTAIGGPPSPLRVEGHEPRRNVVIDVDLAASTAKLEQLRVTS